MVTEAVIISSLKPIIEKAAGTALGKAMMYPVDMAQAKLRNRSTRKVLDNAMPPRGDLTGITADFAKNLKEYLESPDFTSLAMSVAANEFTETGKKQAKKLESAEGNLKAHIGAIPGAPLHSVSAIVAEIWTSLNSAIVEHAHQIHASNTLPPETRAAVVRMAANYARADIKRSELLQDVEHLSSYYDFENSLREQVKNLHATMKLPHAGTTRRVAYSRLFVEPNFILHDDSGSTHNARRADLNETLSTFHRAVILGDPGGGKSTLSLKLAFDIAKQAFPATSAVIPFLVVLRDYTRDFEAGKATMLQYLEQLCKSPYNVNPGTNQVEYALSSGRAFIIFDGLDELIDTSLRRKVVDLVESFAYKYPMAPILVTTRKVGYEEAPLNETLFTPVQLGQLDDTAVRTYADKWFALDSTVDRNRRQDLSQSFYKDSRFVADLTRNPLMLSLMCGIYASENYIPANRPDVYKKCAELLFDKWDKQRGILTPLPFDAHVKHAINALAYSIYSNPNQQAGMSYEQLVRFVKTFLLAKRFEDEDEAENAASQFVNFCTGRAWVLSNIGSDTAQELYGFTHRTFLEYFAANQLVRLNPTADQLFEKIRGKIAAAEWDVVSQLALQIVGTNTEDGIDDFLERVLEAAKSAPLEEEANLVSFAARALSFAVPRPQLMKDICHAGVELALKVGSGVEGIHRSDRSTPSFRGLRSLLHANRENLPTVAKYLRAELTPSNFAEDLQGDRNDIRLALALSISLIPHSGVDDTFYMEENVYELWQKFESDSFDILRSEIVSLALTRKWVAMIAATAGIIPISQVIATFGPEALFQFHTGPFILRAPFVLRMEADFLPEEIPRCESRTKESLAELSNVLPGHPTPWMTEAYDYGPIGALHTYNLPFGKTFSQVDESCRDALALIGAAWCELLNDSKRHPTRDGRGDKRILRLLMKWNAGRLNPDYAPAAVRSIRACSLKPETIQMLVNWVEGKLEFVQIPGHVGELDAE
ncbi:NACHT domain-containing protein [Streptomyces sp. NPDC050529]|uniref:NACHT domain-containing protein n=1 Tax=unclassified Streptomyces TaxID=2593676 RepID=UPI002DDA7B3F|nr:NACHT domain-containing protein [Streptomyces sp. NBC_01022]WRZ82365.1 NACHT domain-containing protein [Streptomyces sp. NBC_01022]